MSNEAFGNSKEVDPDLPLSPDGVTYHVPASSANLADRIILVGDPNRVKVVAGYFDKGSIVHEGSHREINVVTGCYHGVPVSVLSTGMGTDNVEICITEIHILKEYDTSHHKWRARKEDGKTAGGDSGDSFFDPSRVKLIRVGTCGSPNDDIPVGCLAITRHAIGMDNTCQYYESPAINNTPDVQEVLKKVKETTLGKIQIYATQATPQITKAIAGACDAFNEGKSDADKQRYYIGTTCSGSGFYGCQGRSVGRFRGHITAPHLTEELGDLRFKLANGEEERVANLEMESSALCYLSNLLGYQAGTVCVVIARRSRTDRAFATVEQVAKGLANAITIALDAIITEDKDTSLKRKREAEE